MKLWEALKALDEGKEVEWCAKHKDDGPVDWTELSKSILLRLDVFERRYFRIKPQPPAVVEFVLDCKGWSPAQAMDYPETGPTYKQYMKMKGKRWRIVATEIIEGEG